MVNEQPIEREQFAAHWKCRCCGRRTDSEWSPCKDCDRQIHEDAMSKASAAIPLHGIVLAPCMFCESPHTQFMVGADGVAFGVECQMCYATGSTGYNGDDHAMFTPQQIADRWNAASNAASSWRWIQEVVGKTGFIDFGGR